MTAVLIGAWIVSMIVAFVLGAILEGWLVEKYDEWVDSELEDEEQQLVDFFNAKEK